MKFDLGQIKELDQQSQQLFIASSVQMLQANNPGMSPMDAAEVVKNTLEVAKSANIQDPSSLQRLVAVSSEHPIAPNSLSPATENILQDDVLDDSEKVNQAHKQAIYEKEVKEKKPEVTTVEPYPQEKSAELQVQADEELAPMSLPPTPPEPKSSQPCALLAILGDDALDEKKEPEKESEECGFQELQITKEGRDFTYAWRDKVGVAPDIEDNDKDLIEVVVGAEKGSNITLSKKGSVTCSKHYNNSWRTDGAPQSLNDDEIEVLITAKKTKRTSLEHYIPYRIQPERHSFKAVKCGGWKRLNILAYPDTEIKITLQWNIFTIQKEKRSFGDKKTHITTHELTSESDSDIKTLEYYVELSYAKDGTEISSLKVNHDGEITAKATSGDASFEFSRNKPSNKPDPFAKTQRRKQNKWHSVAADFVESFRQTKKLCASFSKVTHMFGLTENSQLKWSCEILTISGSVSGKWHEMPNSRKCVWGTYGKITISPIIKIEYEQDFTNLMTAVLPPIITLIVRFTKAMIESFDNGEFGIKVKLNGEVGLETGEWTFPLPHGEDFLPVKLNGLVGATIRAVVKGEMSGDFWIIKWGAKGHAEAGVRGKLGDSASILQDVEKSVKGHKEDEAKLERQKRNLHDLQSQLHSKFGVPTLSFSLGHTGIEIYYILSASVNVSTKKQSTKPPGLADALFPPSQKKKLNEKSEEQSSKLELEKEVKKEGRKVAIDWNIAMWQPSIELMSK